jgi:hypothetical protein
VWEARFGYERSTNAIQAGPESRCSHASVKCSQANSQGREPKPKHTWAKSTHRWRPNGAFQSTNMHKFPQHVERTWNLLLGIPVLEVPVAKSRREVVSAPKLTTPDRSDVLILANVCARFGVANVLHLPPPLAETHPPEIADCPQKGNHDACVE